MLNMGTVCTLDAASCHLVGQSTRRRHDGYYYFMEKFHTTPHARVYIYSWCVIYLDEMSTLRPPPTVESLSFLYSSFLSSRVNFLCLKSKQAIY